MNVFDTITARLISQLEAGSIPWRKPWTAANLPLVTPTNRATGKPYRGINFATLLFSPYRSSQWVTYKQARELGAQVRKGEHASPVVFWSFWGDKSDSGDGAAVVDPVTKRRMFARFYSVFNVEQCDGFSLPLPFESPREFQPLAGAESLAGAYLSSPSAPPLHHGGARAFYSPAGDFVQMPPRESFTRAEGYYSTLFHEFAHSTGADHRLGRKFGARKGDANYAKEELVAEFAAAFLCAEGGISDDRELDNSAAYIRTWLGRLRDDKTLAVSAAQQAQKAADYILGRTAAAAGETEVAA